MCTHVLTLCDPIDCSPPGSSVHGIFQAGILEWIAMINLGQEKAGKGNSISKCPWVRENKALREQAGGGETSWSVLPSSSEVTRSWEWGYYRGGHRKPPRRGEKVLEEEAVRGDSAPALSGHQCL